MSLSIILSQHAKEQLVFRGVTEEEIIKTIESATWEQAELGRLTCKKDFKFEKQWNKKHYKTKQVKPIFVKEDQRIVVVTVYSYYF